MPSASPASGTQDRVHVGGPRPTPRQLIEEIVDVAMAAPLFAVAPLLRRWHRRWGATDAEVAAVLPGDDLVPGCQYTATRAITIAAPPEAVWPWLAQVGFGKAGFYSNDLLDNVGHPSAERILDEFQDPRIGDWVPMFSRVNDVTAFRVAALEAPRHLVWAKPDSTWAWRLRPAGSGTRVVTRLRILYRWQQPAGALLSLLLNELGDFPMMRKMLRSLRGRAERSQAEAAVMPTYHSRRPPG
jgi:hypothetical protein